MPRVLILLMLIHIGLALGYAAIAPYRTPGNSNNVPLKDVGAPDEWDHSTYVQYVAEKRALAKFAPHGGEFYDQFENHQPPLFYIVDAVGAKALGVNDFRQHWSGFRLRAVNSIVGAAMVAGAFFLALWATGRRNLSLFAAGVVALLPMNAALSGSVSNDPLLAALATWCLALIVRCVTEGWPLKLAAGVGLLAGLAILTKTTGILLLPTILLALVLSRVRGNLPLVLLNTLGIACIVALPLWIRNFNLYNDPFGLTAFQEFFPATIDKAELISDPKALAKWGYVLLAGSLLSFVGVFGYMDIHLPYWIYVPILLVLVSAFIAGLSGTKRLQLGSRAGWWVLGGYFLLVLLGYVQFNLSHVQPQARYMFPALGVMALWIALGVARIGRERSLLLGYGIAAALLLANAYSLAVLPGEFKVRVDAARADGRLPDAER